jgi:rhamnulokinase
LDTQAAAPGDFETLVSARFLALDIGAESGRAILGRLDGGVLTLKDVHRFPNVPVRTNGALHWDILRLWHEVQAGLEGVTDVSLASVGVDTWGCDFALLGEQGQLLENPYHYRDTRSDGIQAQVFKHVPAERIYAVTGIQFLNFNSLFQLYSTRRSTPKLLDSATAFVTIPDLLNYWLTGRLASEYTIATTTQMIDATRRTWATPLLAELGLPTTLFQPLVEPGTVIGGIRHEVSASLADTPVVAPACHDTGSAFASVAIDGGAFLSSGTWSLLGAEVAAPVISARARELNFTNEGGVNGTTRLLKNIAGLWLLQACMRRWAEAGQPVSYDDLLVAARDDRHAFRSLFDPDHSSFFNPTDMPAAIAAYCRATGQSEPTGQPGYARAILESLALKYRIVLDSLEQLTGRRYTRIRIVGGGSRNRLLNQLTADATRRTVLAGPVEATALGNIAMQLLATGTVNTLDEARAIIEQSFPVERFDPVSTDRWTPHYQRVQEYMEVMGV